MKAPECTSHQFSRTPEHMHFALRVVPSSQSNDQLVRSKLAQREIRDLSQCFNSALIAIAFAIDYVECLLTVPRFVIHPSAPAYWEMRWWLPYCLRSVGGDAHVLVNREYLLVGGGKGKAQTSYAKLPHIHVQVTGELFGGFTGWNPSSGYLFSDGNAPWLSRADAQAYLQRLRALRKFLVSTS